MKGLNPYYRVAKISEPKTRQIIEYFALDLTAKKNQAGKGHYLIFTVDSRPINELDEKLYITERVLRYFLRSTQIGESVLKLKLGSKGNMFFYEVFPSLIKVGVIDEFSFVGGGAKARYRLGVHMREIDEAMTQSNGSFDRFLEHISQRVQ